MPVGPLDPQPRNAVMITSFPAKVLIISCRLWRWSPRQNWWSGGWSMDYFHFMGNIYDYRGSNRFQMYLLSCCSSIVVACYFSMVPSINKKIRWTTPMEESHRVTWDPHPATGSNWEGPIAYRCASPKVTIVKCLWPLGPLSNLQFHNSSSALSEQCFIHVAALWLHTHLHFWGCKRRWYTAEKVVHLPSGYLT